MNYIVELKISIDERNIILMKSSLLLLIIKTNMRHRKKLKITFTTSNSHKDTNEHLLTSKGLQTNAEKVPILHVRRKIIHDFILSAITLTAINPRYK